MLSSCVRRAGLYSTSAETNFDGKQLTRKDSPGQIGVCIFLKDSLLRSMSRMVCLYYCAITDLKFKINVIHMSIFVLKVTVIAAASLDR